MQTKLIRIFVISWSLTLLVFYLENFMRWWRVIINIIGDLLNRTYASFSIFNRYFRSQYVSLNSPWFINHSSSTDWGSLRLFKVNFESTSLRCIHWLCIVLISFVTCNSWTDNSALSSNHFQGTMSLLIIGILNVILSPMLFEAYFIIISIFLG